MENVNSENKVVEGEIIMENVNSENKVVEYEIITTKKYRQVVKVQFDEKYSDRLDDNKITPRDIDFGLGEEIEGDETRTYTTKIVNEPPEKFITYTNLGNGKPQRDLGWGNFVPSKTKSVLVFLSFSGRGNNNKNKVVYLSCSMDLVEQLWESSNLKELSSFIVSYEYLISRWNWKGEPDADDGLDFLTRIHNKRTGKDTDIWIYEVQEYIEFGNWVVSHPHFFKEEYGGRKEL